MNKKSTFLSLMILVAAFMTASVHSKIAEMTTPARESGNASRYHLTEATPEDGSTVEELSVITTQWEGPETAWDMDVSSSKEAVIARDVDGNQVATGTLRNVPSGIQIRLSETITTPGEYTVTIMPEMVFGAEDFDEDTMQTIPAPGTGNEETTLRYTVQPAVEPYHLTEATPEDGSTVEELSVIQTQWEGPEAEWGIGVSNSKEAVIARDADGNQVATGTIRNVFTGIQIRLSEKITTPGEYTVTIMPEMVFGAEDIDEDTGLPIPAPGTGNEETTLRYTVQPAIEKYHLTEAKPEDGSTVENLSVIETQWEGPETECGIDVSSSMEAVIVRDADGNQVATGRLKNVPTGVQINLSQTIDTDGDYTVTILAGMVFGADEFDEETMQTIPAPGTENEETTLHYTVQKAVEPYHLTEATPEDGSTVEKLSVIETQWEGTETAYGVDVSSSKEAVIVRDSEGNQVATGTLKKVASGIQITLSQTIETDGGYTVTILAGMVFGSEGFDAETLQSIIVPGTENEETVLHYTVVSQGSADLLINDNEESIYYDLGGKRVLKPEQGIFIRVTGEKREKITM